MNSEPGALVGVDVGGTFTDLVYCHAGTTRSLKVPSTPRQEEGLLAAVDALQDELGPRVVLRRLVHGTTVATNAVLEESWATTALLTTEGFRDVLEIGRQDRPALYDLFARRPRPVVPRGLRLDVPERLDHRGRVVRPVDKDGVRRLARGIRGRVESVAVVLLFSFLNDGHERAVRSLLEEELPGVPVTLSSEVLPEVREYERTSTTVLSAALRPVVAKYLERLSAGLGKRSRPVPLLLMSSAGGVLSAQEAARSPVGLLLSGPAGGVEGARRVGTAAGLNDMITLDMGGTSADVALIAGGELQRSPERTVGGRPVRLPAVDVHTVGAGGGSIARLDGGGVLRVGPQSAGSHPGPACYSRGGTSPTVTDAHLLLGRLPRRRTLGGLLPLNTAAAHAAIARVAGPAGISVEEAAWGILQVVEATMEQAIRVMSVQRGIDPRGFTLIAFGGAGPLHGATLGAKLGMHKILLPAHAGALSALGLMEADLVVPFVRSLLLSWPEVRPRLLQTIVERFRVDASRRLASAGAEGGTHQLFPAADIRYHGQSFELAVPFPDGELCAATVDNLARDFHRRHERLYGYSSPGDPLELVSLRLTAVAPTQKPPLPRAPGGGNVGVAALPPRPVYFGPERGWISCPIFDRALLPAGGRLPSPSIVEGNDTTCLIPPHTDAEVDQYGNLLLEVRPWTQ